MVWQAKSRYTRGLLSQISKMDLLCLQFCYSNYPTFENSFFLFSWAKPQFYTTTGTPPIKQFSYTAVFYLTRFFLGQKPRYISIQRGFSSFFIFFKIFIEVLGFSLVLHYLLVARCKIKSFLIYVKRYKCDDCNGNFTLVKNGYFSPH